MINLVTVDQAIRNLIGHDCENDHVDATPLYDDIRGEVQSPADIGLVTMICAVLNANFIESMVEGPVQFAALQIADDVEHDNIPIAVAGRLVACALNRDFPTLLAVAQAEMHDPEHAEEVLVALLQMSHDL